MKTKNAARFFSIMLCILILGASQGSHALEKGRKYTTHFTRDDHGQHPQNWAVLQDERGVIYVGNNGGILEYDGKSWRTIEIPKHTVRSLAKYHDGTIYVGGVNEIGFLAPTAAGGLEYQSLIPQVKESQRDFSNVRRTLVAGESVYFRGEKFLLRWSPETKKLKAWEATYGFDSSFVCFGKLYIRDGRKGLLYMEGDSLHPAPGGDIFAKEEIFVMPPHDNGYLVITRNLGCFIYNGTAFLPFPTQLDDFLKEKKVYHGIRLSDQNYALATLRGGLVIMDKKGDELHILDNNHDLAENDVKFVYEDTGGNLWLGLDFGILRIEYASPFSIYDNRNNLPNVVLAVQRHRENLYVGSSDGLFVLPEGQKEFRPTTGIRENCWSLLSTGDVLVAATSGGVFLLEEKKVTMLLKTPAYTLLLSPKAPNRIWVGTSNGLASIYRKEGQWEGEWPEETLGRGIRTIAEDDKEMLWLGPKFESVLKITAFHGKDSQVVSYSTVHGLPKDEIRIFKAAGHVIFAGRDGIFRFNDAAGRFIPDDTLGEAFNQPNSMVFKIVEDKHKHIWLHAKSRNYHGTPTLDGQFIIDSIPFLRMPTVQANVIYPEGNRVWFGTNENLVCFDTTGKKNYHQEFHALLRCVVVNGKRVIYKGYAGKQSLAEILVLEYKDRNLFFEFAAPFFEEETATRFRWLMKGYNKDWSSWSHRTEIDYTNLDSGRYTFMVQAQNLYGHESIISNFNIKILPPWYRTWWAIIIYAIIIFIFVLLGSKLRSRKYMEQEQRIKALSDELAREKNSQPPPEIVQKGPDAVEAYFQARSREEEKSVNEIKVLLVGDGGSGKTSLVNRLLKDDFNPNEDQTDGIAISQWPLQVEDISIIANLWDFGGQEIMHATHQFFLSRRSLYVLVLDGRKDEKTEYWFKHIESFGGDSPILVVLNKADQSPGFDVNRKFLKEKYPSIKGFFRLSCKSGEGISDFLKAIKKELAAVEIIRTIWPESWLNIKTTLEQIPNHYISYSEYLSLCTAQAIEEGISQSTLVDFLHDLGVVLHFRGIELENTYVLKPKWVTEAVYKIINSEQLAKGKGILRIKDLHDILKPKEDGDYEYPADKHRYIVELMKKFELCYQLDGESVLVPDLLEKEEKDFSFDYDSALKFVLQYDFLPRSVMPRFMVRMHRDIDGELRWRTGMVLKDDAFEARAVVKADEDAKKISLFLQGKQKAYYFAVLRHTFRDINGTFKKMEAAERIPLPDNPSATVGYQHLLNLRKMGETRHVPEGAGRAYSLDELLKGFEENQTSDLAVKIDRRWTVLDRFQELIIDPKSLERQVHRLIENNLWMLGPEYSKISSDEPLKKQVELYLGKKYTGDIPDKRPDLFLSRDTGDTRLLIEFKRPSHTLDRKDESQVQTYRDELYEYLPNVKINIMLMGGRKKKNITHQHAAPDVNFITYTELLSRARKNLEWLLEGLERDSSPATSG